MELQFQKNLCPCLRTVLQEVRNLEQTQEIRLTEGMPDVGKVLSAWGQTVVRSREWNGDSLCVNAGVMVWVLYAPEEGSECRCVEGWIPLKIQWDLPEDCPQGRSRVRCLTRFVEARAVSARKLLVRAGAAAQAEAFVSAQAEIGVPQEIPEPVELLRRDYPLRLPREAGEREFLLEEELTVPASVPQIDRVLYYTLVPELAEQRVLGDKVVFRGTGNLHILYASPEGRLHSWDFPLTFSQYGDLEASYSPDADMDILLAVTALELEMGEGRLRVRCGLTGQYRIFDVEMLELVEDAYCPGRDLEVHTEELELPVILETREERIAAEQSLAAEGSAAADVVFLPDFPRQRRTEEGVSMLLPGMFQVLYYDGAGALQSASARWEGEYSLPADQGCQVTAQPQPLGAEPQILMGSGDMKLRGELPLHVTTAAPRGIPMVTGLTLGQDREPDPQRPSLILRRAGERGLWDIAKASGSTVEAIRQANHLQQDPSPGQMLLIPIL